MIMLYRTEWGKGDREVTNNQYQIMDSFQWQWKLKKTINFKALDWKCVPPTTHHNPYI